jgi:hypothetical protein
VLRVDQNMLFLPPWLVYLIVYYQNFFFFIKKGWHHEVFSGILTHDPKKSIACKRVVLIASRTDIRYICVLFRKCQAIRNTVMWLVLKLRYSYLRHRCIVDLIRYWRSCLDPLVYLLPKFSKIIWFPTFRLWAYHMKVIPEKRRAH